MHLLEHLLAIVGMELDAIGKLFVPVGQIVQPAVQRGPHIVREPQLENFTRDGMPLDETIGVPSATMRPLSTTMMRSHSCSGLIHVMRRQQQRRSPERFETIQTSQMRCLACRIRDPRWARQQDEFRGVDEGARDREPALHAARQRLDLRTGARSVSCTKSSSSSVRCRAECRRNVEVARVHQRVFAHRQLGVEVVGFAATPRRALIGAGVDARIEIEDTERSTRRWRRTRSSAWSTICRRRSDREYRRLPYGEVDAVDGGERSRNV